MHSDDGVPTPVGKASTQQTMVLSQCHSTKSSGGLGGGGGSRRTGPAPRARATFFPCSSRRHAGRGRRRTNREVARAGPLLNGSPRVEPRFPLLVVGVSGTFSGGGRHGQANRRTAAADLLGRVRRGHHVRRNPAPLTKQKQSMGHARAVAPSPCPRGGLEAVVLDAYGG